MSTVRELESMVGGSDGQMAARPAAPTHHKAAKPVARVLAMAKKAAPAKTQAQKAEDALPLEDTGTFGKF